MSPGASGAEAEVLAGRYRLDERIGVGAMGEVWRARDLTLERDVALKRVRLDGQVEEQAQARFRREAVVMAGLSHPNVVSVYDAGTDVSDSTEIAYLVMELLDGPSCSELLRTHRTLAFEEVQRIAAGVARGLAAAHQAGIVHRDIKPGNVVVSRGVPTIVDFGIARLEQESAALLTAPQTTLGTAAYMSPEQALGRSAGPSSDVYSLGALMVALATGSPPFGASNALALMRAHIDDVPPPLAQLRHETPPHLSDLVERMLAKEPGERPTASEVARALDDGELAASPLLATLSLPVVDATSPSVGASRSVESSQSVEASQSVESSQSVEASRSVESSQSVESAGSAASLGPAAGAGSEEPFGHYAGPALAAAAPSDALRAPGAAGTDVVPDPLAAAEEGAPRRRRGAMWWALAAVLLVVAAIVGLNMLLDGDPSSPDADAAAAPTVTPTERIITPDASVDTAPVTQGGGTPGTQTEPATQSLDAAVGSAATAIAAVEDADARDELQREWQGASRGLQGANAEEQLREVINQAEDLADDDDVSSDELAAIRAAIEQVIALL